MSNTTSVKYCHDDTNNPATNNNRSNAGLLRDGPGVRVVLEEERGRPPLEDRPNVI